MKNIFWPEINGLWDAKKACIQASAVALLVGLASGIMAYVRLKGDTVFSGLGSVSFVDAGIFLFLSFFIYHCSRLANIAGLVLYASGQLMMIPETHKFPVSGIFFSLLLASGVRGAFAYHEMKKGLGREEVKAALKEQKDQTEPKPSLTKRIIGWSLLVIVAAGGVWLYKAASSQSKSSAAVEDAAPQKVPAKAGPPAPPLPGERAFKLKDGRTITGKIVADDPVYYTVETSGGRQEIVIKEDLTSY